MLFKVILKKYKFIKLKKLLKPERFQEFFTIGKVIIQRKVLGNEEFPKWNPQTGFTSVEENSSVMTFASESGFATMLWSKHFATQNSLRPPPFLRGAYLHGQ